MTRKILLAAFAAASMSAFPVSGEDRLPGKSSFDIDTENLYELSCSGIPPGSTVRMQDGGGTGSAWMKMRSSGSLTS